MFANKFIFRFTEREIVFFKFGLQSSCNTTGYVTIHNNFTQDGNL